MINKVIAGHDYKMRMWKKIMYNDLFAYLTVEIHMKWKDVYVRSTGKYWGGKGSVPFWRDCPRIRLDELRKTTENWGRIAGVPVES
jgi:hypothetical protein